MRVLRSVITIFVMMCFAAPGLVLACTLDTEGTGTSINCSSTPFMESHNINADGKSSFKFHGQCSYSSGENAWNKHYYVTATWDGTQAREVVRIAGENKYGTVVSTCPSNPWLDKVTCQKKSLSGAAFSDYQITGATTYPLTANAVSDAQRAQLIAELTAKKAAAACANPVVLSPVPATGNTYTGTANVKIQIKHNPEFPPTDWRIYMAPPSKPGDWPSPGTKQNMPLSGLNTANGVTTWTFSTNKVGDWQIFSKLYFPSYCNKGSATPVISFKVREGGTSMEERLKNLSKKPLNTIQIPGPGPDPDPGWTQQQKLLQQQKLQQQKLQQNLQR